MQQRERWEDIQEAMQTALDGRQGQIWTALPGIVVKRTGNNVSVNLAIQGKNVNQKGVITDVNLPQLINVPLLMPGGGGFAVTLPIGEGDEVLVHFASRCIDGWWQSGNISPQTEVRMHDLSDGFAYPAPMSQPKALANISSDSAQLRSTDGAVYVEIAAGHVVNIVAPGGVNITGNTMITGTLTVTEEITTQVGPVTLGTHKHTLTQTGIDDSGPPAAGT